MLRNHHQPLEAETSLKRNQTLWKFGTMSKLGRRYYFEQKWPRTEHIKPLYNELFCHLTRNTKTNMTTGARATEDARYSSRHKVNTIAKQLVQ